MIQSFYKSNSLKSCLYDEIGRRARLKTLSHIGVLVQVQIQVFIISILFFFLVSLLLFDNFVYFVADTSKRYLRYIFVLVVSSLTYILAFSSVFKLILLHNLSWQTASVTSSWIIHFLFSYVFLVFILAKIAY